MTAFEKWVAQKGGVRATSRILGVSHVCVSKWMRGENGFSRRSASLVVKKSGGDLTQIDLDSHMKARGVPYVA